MLLLLLLLRAARTCAPHINSRYDVYMHEDGEDCQGAAVHDVKIPVFSSAFLERFFVSLQLGEHLLPAAYHLPAAFYTSRSGDQYESHTALFYVCTVSTYLVVLALP